MKRCSCVHTLWERHNTYFERCQEAIAKDNAVLLQYSAVAFTVFLVLYSFVTRMMMPNRILELCYIAFGMLSVGFLLFMYRYRRKGEISGMAIQRACLLFVWTVLAFTITISVFPFPNDPGIFFPLGYMLACTLFILPFQQMAGTLLVSYVIYMLLVIFFKTETGARYDYFSSITTLAFAYFLLYLITELRLRNGEAIRRLEETNRTDELTGMPNRRASLEDMPRLYRRCQRMQLPAAVMMLDVDNFKQLNDRMGHQHGDFCLQSMGAAMRSYADELGILACRYGGEEFLFFIGACTKEKAEYNAQRLIDRIRECGIPGPRGPVTASLGVAVQIAGEGTQLQELIRRADEELYRAKHSGKNRYSLTVMENYTK